VGFQFLDGSVATNVGGAVANGRRLQSLSDMLLILSGNIGTNGNWPIGASFQGLKLSIADFLAGRFAIKDLDGFGFDVPRFQLGDAEIGGRFAIGSVTVGNNTAFYVRLGGSFAFGGIDLSIDIAFSQYGPLVAALSVPLAVPLGPTGLLLSGVSGGLSFGGAPWPTVASPLELLTNPVFQTPLTVDVPEIQRRLTTVLSPVGGGQPQFTWTRGFTLAIRADVTTVATPGILTGDLTIAANIGFGAGGGLRWLASGRVKVFGIDLGAAGLLIDLAKPFEPKLDFAFAMPTPGNPLAFILPAQGQFTLSLRTDGMLEAPILGLGVFFDQLSRGVLTTGQTYFSSTLDLLVAKLNTDRGSRLSKLLLDTNNDGTLTSAESAEQITRTFFLNRLVGAGGLLPTSFTSIDATTVQRASEVTYLATGAFLDIIGRNPQAGFNGLAEFSKVLQNAAGAAIDAGWQGFNPSFGLRGFLQPTIFGFPFGQPTNAVELILDKRGISFAIQGSLIASMKRSLDLISANLVGQLATLASLGFEDRIELGFTLRFPDVGRFAKLLQGGSIIEPNGAVQLLDFLVDTINPFANWEVLFRGDLIMMGFRVGEISGIFFGPQVNALGQFAPSGLFGSRVVNLDPDGDGRPNVDLANSVDNSPGLIGVTTKARYEDLMRWGGALLTTTLFLPKILIDPVAVLTQDVDWTPNGINFDDPFAALQSVQILSDWTTALVSDLTANQSFARIQFFFPSPAVLFDPSSYLTGGAGGSMPSDNGTPGGYKTNFQIKPIDTTLQNLLIDALDSAYVEGFFQAKLLSVNLGRVNFDLTTAGLRVTGDIPWLPGLNGSFTIQRSQLNANQLIRDIVQSPLVARVVGPLVGVADGNAAALASKFSFLTDARITQVNLPFPVAALQVSLNSAPLTQWLANSFGLPAGIFSAPSGDASSVTFGAFTPGFGASGVQRFGGFTLDGTVNVAGLVQGGAFRFEVELFNFTGGVPLPNFVARASVNSFSIPGLNPQGMPTGLLSLTNAFAQIQRTPAGLTAGIGGTVTLLGTTSYTLSGGLTIVVNDANPGLFGELAMTPTAGTGTLSLSQFSLSGSYVLQVNTTGVARTVDRAGVPAAQDPVIPALSAAVRVDGILTLGTLTFNGFFRLSLTGSGLQLEAFSTVDAAPLGAFAASGTLIIDSAGVVGRFELDAAAAVTRTGTGWSFNARFAVEINTRTTAATVPRVTVSTTDGTVSATLTTATISAQTVRLFVAGALTLRQGTGATQTDAFTLQGGFEVAVTPTVMTLNASAFVSVQSLGSFATTGSFQFTAAGAAGIVSLGAALGNTAALTRSGTGYSFDGRFRLEFNTTGAAVTNVAGSGQNLTAGFYVIVRVSGTSPADPATLTLGAFRMSGLFAFQVGTATVGGSTVAALQVAATNATLAVVGAGNNTLFSMGASGALLLAPTGIAAKITLSGSGVSGPGYAFSGGFLFELNTTGLAIPTIAGAAVNLAAGPYTRVSVTGPGGTGNGTLTIAGVNIVGTFTLTAGSQTINGTAQTALTLTASGTLQLRANGVRVFDLALSGALVVFSGGTAARLTVTQSAGPDPALSFAFGLQANTSFTFEVFTGAAGSSVTIPNQAAINAGLRVIASGSMTLGGFTLGGTYTFQIGPVTLGGATQTGVLVSLTNGVALLTAAGVPMFTFNAAGALQIGSTGVAARIALTSAAGASNVSFTQSNNLAHGFRVDGTFFFEVNTTGQTTAIAGIEAGTYVRFGGSGSITFRAANVDTFTATGTLRFTSSGTTTNLRVIGSVAVGFLGTMTVDSSVTISFNGYFGVFGVLKAATATNATLSGSGVNFNARLQLQINTTNATQTVSLDRMDINSIEASPPLTTQSVSINPGTVSLLAAGRLQLRQGSGAGATDAFFADGNFALTVSGSNFSLSGASRVDLRFLGRLTGSFNVTLTSAGVSGVVSLASGADVTLTGGVGFNVGGTFALQFNTTASAVTIGAVTIAPFTVQVAVAGRLQLLQGAANEASFRLNGAMRFEVSGANLRVRGDVTVDTVRFDSLAASLDLQISSAGILTTIVLGATPGSGASTTIDRTGLELNARFRLEVNTTASAGTVTRLQIDPATGSVVTVSGIPQTESVSIAARTVRIFAAGNLQLRDGTGDTATDSFVINGGLTLSVSAGDISLGIVGFVDFGRVGAGLTFSVNSSMTVSSAGVVASLSLGGGGALTRAGTGFAFDARFRLEINTTSSANSVTRPTVSFSTGNLTGTTTVTIPARTIRIAASGSLNIGSSGLFDVHGYFVLRYSGSNLGMSIDAGFNFLGSRLDVDGSATIYTGTSRGVAFDLAMSLNGDTTPLLSRSGFSTNASVRLQVNTRAVSSDGLSANTVRVRVNGGLRIDGFNFSGALNFTASNGLFAASVNLSVNIFGFATASVTGTIRSDGYVNLDGSVGVSVGTSYLGASLSLRVYFDATAGGVGDFSATASGSGHFFGASASASGTLYESGNLTLTFRAGGVNLGSATFDLLNNGSATSGPLANATVFFDANNNLALDAGEPFGLSDGEGRYKLDVPVSEFDRNGNGVIDEGDGFIVAFGGIDRFTGLANTAILRGAPSLWNAGVPVMLTPVTTLGSALIANGATLAQAEESLRRALGLSAFTFSLFNTNPFEQADTPAYRELYRAGVEIQAATSAAAGLLTGANSALSQAGAMQAFQASLATALVRTPTATLDSVLKVPAALGALLTETASATKSTLSADVINGAAQVIAEIVTGIDALAVGSTTFFADVTRYKAVVVTEVATDLAQAGAGTKSITTVVDENTGANLTSQVGAVTLPADFKVPTPPPPPPPEPPQDIVTTLPDGTVQRVRVLTESEDLTGAPRDSLFKVTIAPAVAGTQTVTSLLINVAGGTDTPPVLILRSSGDDYRAALDVIRLTGAEQEIVIELPRGASSTGPISFVLVGPGRMPDSPDFAITRVEITSVTVPAVKPAGLTSPSYEQAGYGLFSGLWEDDDALEGRIDDARELAGLMPRPSRK